MQLGNHLLDLIGGVLGSSCQCAHLVSDDRKAPTLLASPRGLDCGIESKQVRLLGNGLDDVQHYADALDVLALLDSHQRLEGCVRAISGIAGNLRRTGRHLGNGRGQQGVVLPLYFGTVGQADRVGRAKEEKTRQIDMIESIKNQ